MTAVVIGGLLLVGGIVTLAIWIGSANPPDDTNKELREGSLLDPDPWLLLHFHDESDGNLKSPSMRFGLTAKDPKNPEQSKKLTYDEHGFSNNTVVRVDDQEYLFGEPPGKWEEMKIRLAGETEGRPRDGWASSWWLHRHKLKVTQKVEIVPGTQSRLLDTCRVRYDLENHDSRGHKVGLRFLLDTYIGANNGVPFLIPGRSDLCDTRMELATPDFIQALEKNDLRDPGTVALLQFRIGTDVKSPDRVLLGGYPSEIWKQKGYKKAQGPQTGWEVPFLSMQERIQDGKEEIKSMDSAVTMYWNEQPLEPGDPRTVGFAYGLGSVDTRESDGHLLLTVGGRLVPQGDFTLTALVHEPQENETLRLQPPSGFSILKSEAEQKVPIPPRGDSWPNSPVTWRLRAGDDGKYELVVRSSTGTQQTILVNIR